jgi:hypothetical protein
MVAFGIYWDYRSLLSTAPLTEWKSRLSAPRGESRKLRINPHYHQLRLRARVASQLDDTFFEAGFTVAIAEIVVGRLDHFRTDIKSRPLLLVNLAPSLRHSEAPQ